MEDRTGFFVRRVLYPICEIVGCMNSVAATIIENCPNCGTTLLGSHCHECGQKKINHNEFSVRRFMARLVNDFTDLESNKLLRTFSALVVRPGLLTIEY